MPSNKGINPRTMFSSPFTLRILVIFLLSSGVLNAVQATPLKKGASGLPLPRFVSLKSDEVNVRKGPSTEHKVIWVYRKSGWPVEIIAEFENWRQVRDSDGNEGWVFHALLSGKRTALVSPWQKDRSVQVPVYKDQKAIKDKVSFIVEAGILADVNKCDGSWCKLSVGDHTGWIKQEKLWGVYKEETVK